MGGTLVAQHAIDLPATPPVAGHPVPAVVKPDTPPSSRPTSPEEAAAAADAAAAAATDEAPPAPHATVERGHRKPTLHPLFNDASLDLLIRCEGGTEPTGFMVRRGMLEAICPRLRTLLAPCPPGSYTVTTDDKPAAFASFLTLCRLGPPGARAKTPFLAFNTLGRKKEADATPQLDELHSVLPLLEKYGAVDWVRGLLADDVVALVPHLLAGEMNQAKTTKLLQLAHGTRSQDIWHAAIANFQKWPWVNPWKISEAERTQLGNSVYDILVGVWCNSERFDEDGLVRTRIFYQGDRPPKLYRVATLPLMINRRKPAVA
ncbi:uncharacterized protein LOC62_07G009273 [Vanrija pseudolonga]|uniref:BTB domain-containing protein n=1 Tax=Vanrija pseudolonga TaxID=143232 RepID=A0AAF0YHM0_9TREE|nr:hypothetical protein LOC62_07G009273 [Vanrija pseudolonga]